MPLMPAWLSFIIPEPITVTINNIVKNMESITHTDFLNIFILFPLAFLRHEKYIAFFKYISDQCRYGYNRKDYIENEQHGLPAIFEKRYRIAGLSSYSRKNNVRHDKPRRCEKHEHCARAADYSVRQFRK